MKVGQFPWVLSKYEKGVVPKIVSILLRIILSFHPFIFLIVLFYADLSQALKLFDSIAWHALELKLFDSVAWQALEATPILLYSLFAFILLLIFASVWLFCLSLGFLRPIVFDVVEEAKRQSGEEKIASAIKEQTEKIDELLKLLQKRDSEQ